MRSKNITPPPPEMADPPSPPWKKSGAHVWFWSLWNLRYRMVGYPLKFTLKSDSKQLWGWGPFQLKSALDAFQFSLLYDSAWLPCCTLKYRGKSPALLPCWVLSIWYFTVLEKTKQKWPAMVNQPLCIKAFLNEPNATSHNLLEAVS
jgi:hypothetical protein